MIAKNIMEAIRDIGQKEVLSIPPLLAVETRNLQHKVKVEQEEQEVRKSSSTPPGKRVKEIATEPGKRQKTILPPVQRKITQIKDDEDIQVKKKTWKPKIEKVNEKIIHDGDFSKMNKYYDLYNYSERVNLENVIVRHMILVDNKFYTIQGKIPDDLFEKLVNKKKRATEEDNKIIENIVRKLCDVRDEDHFKEIMKELGTHMRTKKITIQIMGGNYEEINK